MIAVSFYIANILNPHSDLPGPFVKKGSAVIHKRWFNSDR